MVVRVLIVDDYHPWLRFIRSMLQDAWELQIVGEASDGREAVQKAINLQPDLILLDVGLPTINGIEAARQIREHDPQAKIIFLSEQRSEDVVREALSTASGYVVKSNTARELFPVIKAVLQGGRPYGQNLTETKVELDRRETNTVENHHEVNSYLENATFMDGLARFVGSGLKDGSAIIVLAEESHRVNILRRLKSEGVDVAAAVEQKRYFSLDIPDGFHTFQFAKYLATDAVKAARERNLRVAVA